MFHEKNLTEKTYNYPELERLFPGYLNIFNNNIILTNLPIKLKELNKNIDLELYGKTYINVLGFMIT